MQKWWSLSVKHWSNPTILYCTEVAFIVSTPAIQSYHLILHPHLKDCSELCHVMMDWVPPSGILNTFLSNNNMTKYFRSSLFAAMLHRPGRLYYGNLVGYQMKSFLAAGNGTWNSQLLCNLKVHEAVNYNIPDLMYEFVVIRPTNCRAYNRLIILLR